MERITRLRAGILLTIVVLGLSFFGFKLYSMQVINAADKGSNVTTYLTRTRVRAARGDILDTNGNVLVRNRASYDMVFNHYVILNSTDPNESLLKLAHLCLELGIKYVDHFPVTQAPPFTYTLEDYNSAWHGYFQAFLTSRGNLDSDITAPLLMKALRESYLIPEDWSDEDARLVLGMRYELTLRNVISSLPNYVFIEDAPDSSLAALQELSTPGLRVEASTVREYNTEYAAHVLGYVSPMTKDQVEEYTQKGYPLDALVGQSGFEQAFEDYLHATDGIRVDEVTKDGTVIKSYYEVAPKAGNNVEATIDLLLQIAAEDSLAKTLEDLRKQDPEKIGADAEGGAVVALDVKTGEVLVCASYPTYDLANLFKNYNEILNTKYAPLLNRALMATYPPGSTYKMSMVVAGIHDGYIKKDTVINDKGVFDKYKDFSASCLLWESSHMTHGDINCMEALMHSCNYFFYDVADNIPIDIIDSTAKGFGLGEHTGVELFENIGHRANAATKNDLFAGTDDAGWYPADQIMTSIGQSFNKFTPMQLGVYVSTLCNQGTRYKATFLNRVVSSDYTSLVYENQKQIISTMKISDEAFEAYTTGMEMVANFPDGTAYTLFHDYPVKVAAKTGTAETDAGSDNSAFICYAPADDPQIAVVAYGEKAGYGSRMGKVAKAVLDAYFGFSVGQEDSWENQVS